MTGKSCSRCKKYLSHAGQEKGATIIAPPNEAVDYRYHNYDLVQQFYLCTDCFNAMMEWAGIKDE